MTLVLNSYKLSLLPGEETEICLYNTILGGGTEGNNCAWNDFVVKWQFSCEDEDNTVYWYEMSKHIDYADSSLYYETWPVKYLG